MAFETIVFGVGLVLSGVLLFAMVFYLISYSDLESDYVNPIELCSKLNALVLPEYALHAAMIFLLILNFQFMAVFLNLPLLGYHYYRYTERKHWHDPTEIFRKLPEHKREAICKLAFYLFTFFYYFYRMIASLLSSQTDYHQWE